ncbi:MAG: hypothetical protein JXB10_12725 [Pirellulales bacterium]|nr:hypothetical protein [Pirellulales bacterium]
MDGDTQATERIETPGAHQDRWQTLQPPHLARQCFQKLSDEEFTRSLTQFPLESPNPILRLSREGAVLFANPASQKSFPEWEISPGCIVPDPLRTWVDVAFLALETCPYEIEWKGRWYQWFFVPFSEAGYVNAYGFDVTEQKNAQRTHQESLAELERKNTELELFVYVVSHDLKTPLITIRGFLDHLEHDAAEGRLDRIADDIARIRKAARKMQLLLDDILQLSRIGRVANSPEMVPMGELVQEAIELATGPIERSKAQVSVANDLPLLWGDRQRLLEVFQNLIDNAAKFTGEQPDPQIEIGVCDGSPEGGGCICYVRDNGIGINPRYHGRVFELFEKLEPKSDGAGVGLALVKRIIEWHGGRVWVESEGRGTGSTFYFFLPPKKEEKEDNPHLPERSATNRPCSARCPSAPGFAQMETAPFSAKREETNHGS